MERAYSLKLKKYFKSPENIEELKALYRQNDLIYYTPAEETLNVITHALGVVYGFIMLIAMSMAAHSSADFATAVISSLFIMIMYGCSTAYHAVYNVKIKRILRRVDYASINLTVLACGSGICLLYGNVAGYAIFGVSCALSFAVMLMTLLVFGKFRYVAVVSNFVIGALLSAAYIVTMPAFVPLPFGLFIAGLLLTLLGACFFGVKTKFFHTVFHVFVFLGPMLCILSNYFQIVA